MPTRWPDRLAIRGSNITLPDGKPAHLRGFNLLFQLDTMYAYPRVDTDGLLKRLLPGANIVRLVMLHWDDRPTEDAGPNNENDCSEVQRGNDGHTIRVRCLEQFDDVLRWTARQGLWAIITARASIAAGEPDDHGELGDTLFTDRSLRARFTKTWTTIADRYKSFEMIAGYEILSEPRVQPNQVPIEQVREFYEELITSVQRVDARTPIFVGPAPFYSRANLNGIHMPSKHNIIYNFNFFVPRPYVQQIDTSLSYPGNMKCCDLHDKDHRKCCPNAAHNADLSHMPCCATPILVDKKAIEEELLEAVTFGKTNGVPVLMDQWGVMRGAAGRVGYLRDMLSLLEKHRVHNTYWQWRHMSNRPFAVLQKDEDKSSTSFDLDTLTLFADVLAVGDAKAAAELKALNDAKCYAQRYPELIRQYCNGRPNACDLEKLRQHYHEQGRDQMKVFECDAAECFPWCAEHDKPWSVKCATFKHCMECQECSHPPSPLLPPPSPPPPPSPSPARPLWERFAEAAVQPHLPPPSPRPKPPLSPRPPPPPPSPLPPPTEHIEDAVMAGAEDASMLASLVGASSEPQSVDSDAMGTPEMTLAVALLVFMLAMGIVTWRRTVGAWLSRRGRRPPSARKREKTPTREKRRAPKPKKQPPPQRGNGRYERVIMEEEDEEEEHEEEPDEYKGRRDEFDASGKLRMDDFELEGVADARRSSFMMD